MIARKKRQLIMIISIVLPIIIVIGVLVALYFTTDMFKPKNKLFQKYLAQNLDTIDKISNLDATEITDALNNQKLSEELKATLSYRDNNNNMSNTVNKAEVDISGQTCKKENYNYQEARMVFENADISKFEYLQDGEDYGIRLEGIEQFISAKNENLNDLETLTGIPKNKLELITLMFNPLKLSDFISFTPDELKVISSTYSSIIEQNTDAKNFKQKSNQNIEIDGNNYIANAYVLEQDEEQLNSLIIALLERIEKDEIILGIRSMGQAYKLLLTSNASNPKFHFTQTNPSNPMTPPLFCMVMRKHLQSGKIIKIEQPDFDRILNIYVESLNELGDYSVKKLVLEIMGRHSNIILTDENNTILDCIKHIGHDTSSVREVLPGREYTLPPSQGKINTLELDNNNFNEVLENNPSFEIQSVIYKNYTGISPIAASEICYRANVNGSTPVEALTDIQKEIVFNKFAELVEDIKANRFYPESITNEKGKTIDFSPIEMTQFNGLEIKKYTSISELIESFYANRDFAYRIGQKTQDLRKLITQNIERCIRKKDIQMQTLRSIKNRDELRLKGELLTANIYSIKKGMTTVELPNYYSENQELVAIELDSNKTPSENAQKYYKAYNKAKRTFEALKDQIKSNDEELAYLESVLTSVNNCTDEQDVKEIRRELREEGYVKKVKNQKDKSKKHSVPLHFISQDGFDIYVGKNNIQNDELTLKFARPRDIWMHTKNIPGSHVIIVANGQTIPDTTLNEGAMLSAFYSKAKNSSKVPVDYTEKKNVKKPNGSKPGFVIYETNKTAYITTSEEEIKKIRRGD